MDGLDSWIDVSCVGFFIPNRLRSLCFFFLIIIFHAVLT
jgi:hypothetical protein